MPFICRYGINRLFPSLRNLKKEKEEKSADEEICSGTLFLPAIWRKQGNPPSENRWGFPLNS